MWLYHKFWFNVQCLYYKPAPVLYKAWLMCDVFKPFLDCKACYFRVCHCYFFFICLVFTLHEFILTITVRILELFSRWSCKSGNLSGPHPLGDIPPGLLQLLIHWTGLCPGQWLSCWPVSSSFSLLGQGPISLCFDLLHLVGTYAPIANRE